MSATISEIAPVSVRVSGKTVWTFIRVRASDGLDGIGEATVNGFETQLWDAVRRLAPAFEGRGTDPRQPAFAAVAGHARSLVPDAVASAVDMALWDIEGQRQGRSVAALLGTQRRPDIEIYANINRRTTDRSLAGFRASARDAAGLGFRAVKIAPFDGVEPSRIDTPEGKAGLRQGIARIAATREALGPDIRLMVDCHWRLDEARAAETLRAIEPLGIFWFECPLPEEPARFAEVRRLRSLANGMGIRLAGCELQTSVEGFRPFVEAGLYDVIMPDVKYAGGLLEMLRIAEFAATHGVIASPHNPTGPVCHAASLHVSAVLDDFLFLEQQFDESPLFDGICRGLPPVRDGMSPLPGGAGLGVALDDDAVAASAWTPGSAPSAAFGASFFNRRGAATEAAG